MFNLQIMKKTIVTIFIFIISQNIFSQKNALWKFQTEGRVYSTPLIDNEMVYFGSLDTNFYAINKQTGQEIWRFKTEGEIRSSACVVENIVYFASADGNLYAVNKTNGTLLWKFGSQGEKMYDLWDYYLSSPISDSKTIFWGSSDGNIYALKGENGNLKWKYQTDDIIHASPVIYNDKIYFGNFNGNFYCLQKENGTLDWQFKTIGATYFPKGEIQRAALVENDAIYFGSRDYNMYALDVKTGRGKWNMKEANGWIIAPPIEYKGNIYLGTSDAHKFYSMNKTSGLVNWSFPLSMRVYGSAVANDDKIYFGTFDGKIIGLNYLTGKIEWEYQTPKSRKNYSLIYDEKGEFNKDFELYGKEYIKSEALIHSLLGSILSSPVIENERIYFGSSDGCLYSVELN